MTSVSLVERRGWACGTPPGMRPHLAVKRKRSNGRGRTEEVGPVEETRQEGDEQVWVEPAGRALPGCRGSHVDAEWPAPGVMQWVAGGRSEHLPCIAECERLPGCGGESSGK